MVLVCLREGQSSILDITPVSNKRCKNGSRPNRFFFLCRKLAKFWIIHVHTEKQAEKEIHPSSGLLSGVMWYETDVSEHRINPISKGKVTQPTNPKDGRIQFNRGESLQYRKKQHTCWA
jgi:hypothetical protein